MGFGQQSAARGGEEGSGQQSAARGRKVGFGQQSAAWVGEMGQYVIEIWSQYLQKCCQD